MNKIQHAAELFLQGFNCSQAVFTVFAEKYGLTQELALKVGCGFGAGIRNAEVCGAVSGAIMVIGLCHGHSVQSDEKSKQLCYEKTKQFTNAFKAKNKSIICRDLLGIDIFEGDGMQRALDKGLFKTTCVDMVCDAVAVLEEMGY